MFTTTRGQLKKTISAIALVALVVFTFASYSVQTVQAASAPNMVNYQGRITDTNGTPVTDSSLEMEFFFYDASEVGNCIWSNSSSDCDFGDPDLNEARTVSLSSGLFSELLGDVDDAEAYAAIGDSIFGDNAAVYLEVVIEGETLDPRKRMGAVPYALNADTLDGQDSSAWLQATNNLSDLDNAATARGNLDLEIGTDVQAYDADLSTLAGLTEADSTFIVGTGSGWTTESGVTVRTSLGLGSLATLSTVDISDNTNLVAGTNITLTDDTLSVDDAFMLNTGDSASGDYSFTGSIDLTPSTNIDAVDISGANLTSASALDIDSGNTSGNVIDLALNPDATSTANGIAVSTMTTTGNTLSGDLILLTMDAVDADGYTGDGLKIVIDTSQSTGYPIRVETDGAGEIFSVMENGNVVIGNDLNLNGDLIDADGELYIESGTATALTLNSGTTGVINIGNDGSAESINIGTGSAVKTVVLGSSDTTSSTTIQSGSGDITLDSADDVFIDVDAGAIINIGDNATAKTIDIGGVDTDGNDTINIATDNTTADTITIGNTNAATVLSLFGGGASLIDFVDFDVAATGAVTSVPDSNVTALTLTGTNVTSASMAYLYQPNDATSPTLEIESDSKYGAGLLIDQNDDGIALRIDSDNLQNNTVDINAGNTTGDVFDLTANNLISGGNVFQLSANALVDNGNIIDISSTAAMDGTVDFIQGVHGVTSVNDLTMAGDLIDLQRNITQNIGGTTTQLTGSVGSFSRNLTGTLGTVMATGALVDISSTASVTGGVVTDAASMLNVAQNYSGATGKIVKITNEGVGEAIYLDQNGNGRSLFIDSAATSADMIDATALLTSGTMFDLNLQPVSSSTATVFDIDILSGPVSGNVFEIDFGISAHSGNAIDIDMGTNVSGEGVKLASSGSSGSLFDATMVLSDAVAGAFDFNVTTDTDSVEGINLEYTVQDDNDDTTETFAAFDITATQNSNDAVNDDHLYGLHVNNLGGAAQTGNEYAIYQEGTAWDLGLLIEDDSQFNGKLTIDQANIDLIADSSASNYLDIGADIWSLGNFINVGYDTAEVQTGDLIGLNLDLGTNLTAADGFSQHGINIKLRSPQSTTAVATNIYGVQIGSSGSLTQSTAAGTINYYGLNVETPITIENTGTIEAYGLHVATGEAQSGAEQFGVYVDSGTIPGSGGTQTGFAFEPYNIASGAGQQIGLHLKDASSSNAPSKRGIWIENGWDNAIYINGGAFAVEDGGDLDISSISGNDLLDIYDGSGSYTGDLLDLDTTTSAGTGFNIIDAKANSSLIFRVNGQGTVTANIPNSGSYTAALCWDNSGLSEIQDCVGSVNADYAEMYPVASDVSYGDVVKIGSTDVTTETGETIKQLVKADSPYEVNVIGIVSNNYGDFSSTGYNVAESDNPMPVALVGRVPVKVTDENGSIEVGDALTTSSTEGYAMKATAPGMIIGYALETHTSGDGEVMVFVDNGWHASGSIITDGDNMLINDDIIALARGEADASTNYNSHGFTLRGSAWDGAAAADVAMTLVNDVSAVDDYRLSIRNTSDTEVAYVTNDGTLSVANDVIISGKLYPSDRGTAQTSKYIYYDGSTGMGGDFMRTNASGWATGSYDFAEMFPSTEELEAGDVVVFAGTGANVRRGTTEDRELTAGIVSTRPGFLAGDNLEGDYPIALAGRVPTKVTLENGPIAVGDPLTVSSLSGYAMKATEAGMVVGYALEPYTTATETNAIITFVNTSYYDGGEVSGVPGVTTVASGSTHSYSGLNLTGDIFMTGYQLRGIGGIEGAGDAWSIAQDGSISTQSTLSTVTRSLTNEMIETSALTSKQVMITLSGTSRMEGGDSTIRFEKFDPTFNDVIAIDAPMYVVVTPHGPSSMYVSHKDRNSFTVKHYGGDKYVDFDWMVMAYRMGYEPEELPAEEDAVEEELVEEEVVVEEVVDEPVVEELIIEEPIIEEPVIEDSLVEEPVEEEEVVEEIIEEPALELVEELIEEVIDEVLQPEQTQEEVVEEEPASPQSTDTTEVIIPTGSSDDGGDTA